MVELEHSKVDAPWNFDRSTVFLRLNAHCVRPVEAIPEAPRGQKTRLERENGVNKLLLSFFTSSDFFCVAFFPSPYPFQKEMERRKWNLMKDCWSGVEWSELFCSR